MRHNEREQRTSPGFRREEQRPYRREASERRDWYEQDEMDEHSGYRDEEYRPSSEYRQSLLGQRDFEGMEREGRRTQGSRELNRNRPVDGNRRGSSFESSASGRWDREDSRRSTSSFSGRGPKSYKRSDERIKEDVCEMLTRDHHIDADGIEVEVKEGEVTLSGSVPDRRMKHMAEDCAEGCYGVRDVTNNIRVNREAASSERDSSLSGDRSATGSSSKKSSTGSSTNIPNH